MNTPPSDQYDTPWKEAVEQYFAEFMAFYFPDAHRQIDWSKGYTFLDQELQAVTRDAAIGKRFVDKLVRLSTTTACKRAYLRKLPGATPR